MKNNTSRVLGPFLVVMFLAGGAVGAQEKVSLDREPNLMEWWKFDETTGTTAADSSKYACKSTLLGESSFDANRVHGKVGRALRLAETDAVVITGYKGITGTGPRTVGAWIRTTKTRGAIVVWGTNESGKQFRFGHIRGRIGMTPFGGYLYVKQYTNNDKWHHVAVVVGESDLPNLHDDVTFYLDGEVAEIDDIGLLDLLPIETGDEQDVRIGDGYVGLIDDLRIYDRALSTDEVRTICEGKSDKPKGDS